jgi:hypothetical protein
MAPPPTELHHITTGASTAASTAASNAALASGASTTTSAVIGSARERAQRMIDATALEHNLVVIAATSTALASNTEQLIAEDQVDRSERQANENKRRRDQLAEERAADATAKSSMAGVAEASLKHREASLFISTLGSSIDDT